MQPIMTGESIRPMPCATGFASAVGVHVDLCEHWRIQWHTKLTLCVVLVAATSGCYDANGSLEKPQAADTRELPSPSHIEGDATWNEEHRVYTGEALQEIFVTEYSRTTASKGFAGPVMVDPETGQLARRALVCSNPQCAAAQSSEGAKLFAYRYKGARATSDGRVEWPEGEVKEFPHVCPHCGRADHLELYLPADLNQRRTELKQELACAQAAWSAASAQRLNPPTDHRSPTEIAREISDLPGVYLVEE